MAWKGSVCTNICIVPDICTDSRTYYYVLIARKLDDMY